MTATFVILNETMWSEESQTSKFNCIAIKRYFVPQDDSNRCVFYYPKCAMAASTTGLLLPTNILSPSTITGRLKNV